MSDDLRRRDLDELELNRFWNELVRPSGDQEPDLTGSASELAETVRELRALSKAPPPAAARERLRRGLFDTSLTSQAAMDEPKARLDASVLPRPNGLNGRVPSSLRRNANSIELAVRPRLRWGRWGLAQLAVAAPLVIALGLGVYVFAPFRTGPDRPRSIPAAVAPIATPEVDNDVSMFRGNPAHTGEMAGPGPDPDLPVVERWSFTAGRSVSTPAVVDGVVYVGSQDGNLYALDAASGTQLWAFLTGAEILSTPAVVNGVVYVGSQDGNLYAIDAASGVQRWSFATPLWVKSSPTVVNGVVYVGGGGYTSGPSHVFAIDAASGVQRWAFATGDGVESSPAVVDGVVYVGSGDGNLYAIDAATGAQRWSFAAGGRVESSPAVVDGVVYVGSRGSTIYALDAASGEERWSFPVDEINVLSSPAVVDGVVYVGSGGVQSVGGSSIYAIDAASGEQLWAFATGGTVMASPTLVDGIVYVGSWDHSLYALDARSGELQWSFTTGDAVGDAVVVDGIVYVGSEDMKLYALESAPP
jgi:outer membrane protein assembly factor BamB